MVFQTFALLPWLTVQQDVEIGLEAQGIPATARAEQARKAIDLIGLDSFATAYSKEFSGGMRQRVGFARALVVEPDVLLMDEPFSALDVLTAENLRGELLELWDKQEFPTKAILIVTHNIEEAVLLADHFVVLGSNPGRIRTTMAVPFARPRDRHDKEFEAMVNQIYMNMTGRDAAGEGDEAEHFEQPVGQLTPGDVPLVDALDPLGFVTLKGGKVYLSPEGVGFAGADIQASKTIFGHATLSNAPLVAAITRGLERSSDDGLPAGLYTDILRRSFSDEETEHQLDIAVDRGRYGELYDYNPTRRELRLDDERRPPKLSPDG